LVVVVVISTPPDRGLAIETGGPSTLGPRSSSAQVLAIASTASVTLVAPCEHNLPGDTKARSAGPHVERVTPSAALPVITTSVSVSSHTSRSVR
jgi:hypothetical protein